jgi:CheY-like chemotaxis protein
LGLAISKRLSELMGGTMWVESPPSVPTLGEAEKGGPGSIFYFTIRAKAASAPARAYRQGTQPQLSGKRVLIVDDNATNRHVLTLQTRSWGMLPQATAFSSQALDWIRRGDPFDVAILDMHMPGMDGLSLAHAIRQLETWRRASLPLVMLSSVGQRGVDGANDLFASYLTKPIKASQLYEVLSVIFAAREDQSEGKRGVAVESQFDAQMGKRHPLRILLAEDNAINQKLALRLLERMGYRADLAGNGLEAIEALQRQPYDVILMDVQMPEMDGLEATRVICREWEQERRPRIIAMTANAMKEDREECLAAGMDDYVSKPIRVDELVGALSRCAPLVNLGESSPAPASVELYIESREG